MPLYSEENIKKECDYILYFFKNEFAKRYKCYLKDLDRAADFHNLKCPDSHKQAAHIMYWFVKIKPIKIIDGKGIYDKPSAPFINEIFAYYLGIFRLELPIPCKNISSGFMLNFLYMLHYRHIRPEPLYMMMYLLEKSAKKEIA